MSKLIGVRLNKDHQEKLSFLYNLYQIESETDTERFRKLLDAIYSEKRNLSDTPTLSTTQHQELELLDGWDCVYRVLIYPHNKFSKKKEPKIFCLNPTTREILKTNELYIAICKKCHDTNGSINAPELPAPKKQDSLATEKEEFLKKARLKNRKCVDCGEDISTFDEWKTRCMSCWRKKQNPASQSETKPLRGSPMDLRKREADAIRRANERMNKEE